MGGVANRRQWLWQVICIASLVLPLVACSGAQVEPTTGPTTVPPTPIPLPRLDGKHALFVVPDRFSDVEYRIPRSILEELGAVITVASWSSDPLLGSAGNSVQPEFVLADLQAGDYDAIVFVGGQGVNPTAPETQRVVREAVDGGKVLAAICAAQGILTRAGLREGAPASGAYVERDGRIITASGPSQAREFGEAIAAALGE
jgi:protease I